MRKNVVKILLVLFCLFISIDYANCSTSTSLKDLKEELAKDEAEKDTLLKQEQEVKEKMAAVEKEISSLVEQVDECNKKIEESKQKIKELEEEIVEKQKEIESLLSFKQISDGDNVYLEYIFESTSFADFIYRSAIVEQLSEYNDNLIDEMNTLIEENKKLQEELQEEIEESENKILELNKKINSLGLDMENISEDQKDVEADIKAKKKEVEYLEEQYEKNGCSESTTIKDCIKMPYATGFTRPTDSGYMSSNYGYRLHPTLGYYRMHNGVDIGLSNGNKVYATAAGEVSKITVKSSCGGNMVYIRHLINGKEYTSVYMHLLQINVSVGDIVTMYDVIGLSGGGGSTLKKNGGWDTCSTGGHLHFGIMVGWSNTYYVDPRNYIDFPAKGSSYKSRF